MSFLRPSRLAPLVVVLCAIVLLARTSRAHNPARPSYDPSTVVTVDGIVHDVQQHECSLGWAGDSASQDRPTSWLGTHVLLRTDYGVLDVHLGPSSFLKSQHFTLAKGDQIEVTGSKFAGELPVIIIAKEVKKGRGLLELREHNGRPLWQVSLLAELAWPAPRHFFAPLTFGHLYSVLPQSPGKETERAVSRRGVG